MSIVLLKGCECCLHIVCLGACCESFSCVGKLFPVDEKASQTELTCSSASWDRFRGALAICVYCGCVFNLRGQGLHWQRGCVTLTVSDKTTGPEKRARSNLIAAQAERMDAELMRGMLCVPCAFQIRRKTKLAFVPSI